MTEQAPNIFLAIPAYDGKLHWETVHSIINEMMVASGAGYKIKLVIHPGNSIIQRARNLLLIQFLESDCTHILFVDSDVAWPAGKGCTLAKDNTEKVGIVGGAYPVRCEPERYMVRYLDKPELHADPETGFLEVEGLPGGFLCIRRDVVQSLVEQNPHLVYEEPGATDKKAYLLFDMPLENGQHWGEDMWFCRLARKCGFKVWLAPEINFLHIGYKAFAGSIGRWLLNREKKNEQLSTHEIPSDNGALPSNE